MAMIITDELVINTELKTIEVKKSISISKLYIELQNLIGESQPFAASDYIILSSTPVKVINDAMQC